MPIPTYSSYAPKGSYLLMHTPQYADEQWVCDQPDCSWESQDDLEAKAHTYHFTIKSFNDAS